MLLTAGKTLGVSSFGTSGTNVHHIITCCLPKEKLQLAEGRHLSWFPSNFQREAKLSPGTDVEYYIAGTWNAYSEPEEMQEEAEGLYSAIVVLGENRWEAFQIWTRDDQVLHPGAHHASSGSKVLGPSPKEAVGLWSCWRINGQLEKVRLINEAQAKEVQELCLSRAKAPSLVVAFPGDSKPSGFEHADIEGMPVEEMHSELVGLPGDRYRVQLDIRGKYRRVELKKLPLDHSASATKASVDSYKHAYFVVGDFNFWSFSPMQAISTDLFATEVQLLRECGSFQVVRDKDWNQTFYPSGSEDGTPILGPEDCFGVQRSWKLTGQAGDIFRIEFSRSVSPSGDDRSVSWSFVRNVKPDFEALAANHSYSIVGSWTDFAKRQPMTATKDAAGRVEWTADIEVGVSGRESFQFLLNGNWLAAVYPKTDELGIPRLCGPDEHGCNMCWTIGEDQDDPYGDLVSRRVRIALLIASGFPFEVRWAVNDECPEL